MHPVPTPFVPPRFKPYHFRTSHSYVLARETIWSPQTATRFPTPAPWPTLTEQVRAGQRRVASSPPGFPRRLDLARCLSPPREFEWYVKWFSCRGLVDPWAFDYFEKPRDGTEAQIQEEEDEIISAIGSDLLECLGE